MQIILVPGFWLTADSWAAVTPRLEAAGHRVRALTLPGLESLDASRAGIGLDDHIDAVVAAIDEVQSESESESVVLVGHSGGGAIIHGRSMPARIAWPTWCTWTARRSGKAPASMMC